jgi:hypothetical protein
MIRAATLAAALAATALGGCQLNHVREITSARVRPDASRAYVIVGLRGVDYWSFEHAVKADGSVQAHSCLTHNQIIAEAAMPPPGETRFVLFDAPPGVYNDQVNRPDGRARQSFRADPGEVSFFGVFPPLPDGSVPPADLAAAEAFAGSRGLGAVTTAEVGPLRLVMLIVCTP